MNYRLVSAATGQGLEDLVNRLIQDGWLPQGGVVIEMKGWSSVYVQAMYKQSDTFEKLKPKPVKAKASRAKR